MYLKTLELQGFKSFADKTCIRFGGGITAIVGPNGSGKSNISDAILWVLGEQSTKMLRGAKMEDVIFGGTQKRSPVGFAEATLTFDNADRALRYDADEVAVTRRYYRSGDGEYYINRRSARLKDINELFMDTGLGREGYANIGQGRIDEILALKSGDRREIFEEAAGISKYRHRKEETQRQLDKTEDNLLRIGDKVSELELQLEPLKAQADKAEQYLAWTEELRGLEVAAWLDSLERLSQAAKKAEEDYASAAFVLQQAHDDLDSLYRRADGLEAALREKDAAVDSLRDGVSGLQAENQQLERRRAVAQSDREHQKANLERANEELQSQDDRSGGLVEQIWQTETRIGEITGQLRRSREGLDALQRQLSDLTVNAQGLTKRFLEGKAEETALTAAIAACQAELRSASESLTESGQRLARLEDDLSSGDDRRQQAEALLEVCRRELAEAREQVTAANNTIRGYAIRQSGREKNRDAAAEEVGRLKGELDAAGARIQVYRAMERDYESYQKSVRMVMQEADRGRLRNLHGPVSKRIRTEDAYTVAIEIALGAAMQQIIVETEADGKAAIQYLKRTGAGRATFLPLSTIQGRRLSETGLESCRGFVGVAADLVQCEPCYRAVVDNLLGRTVLTEDMDAAIAMSRRYGGRFKIVTLDGQVMNPGGSMTGGSVNKDAGILSRANDLARLEKREAQLQTQLLSARQSLQEAQRLFDQTEFQMTSARDSLRETENRVLRLEGEEKQHEIRFRAIEEAENAADRERQAISDRRKADLERLEALRQNETETVGRLAALREELAALAGSQSEADGAVNRIAEAVSTAKAQQAALEAERTTANAHLTDLRRLRADMEGDRQKKEAAIAEMTAQLRQQTQLVADLEEQQKALLSRLAQRRTDLQVALDERSKAEADKTRCQRDSQEKSKDIVTLERAAALLEQKKVTTAMEERQIIDRLWDTYGLTPGTAGQLPKKSEVSGGSRSIAELKRRLAALGTPNLGAIDEYARIRQRYDYLTAQRDDVRNAKRELEGIIRDITKEMTEIFVTEFGKINHYFGTVFAEMFGGGRGELRLENPEEPLSCGIDIRVQPPGKQVKTITLLSGGEKAFVATALYFAILKVRPTPFCLLDEIDAALDDRNVERFSGYLRNLDKTQFIVITHRRGTMEASDILYGVTMQEQGVSRLIRLDLAQMTRQLGIE